MLALLATTSATVAQQAPQREPAVWLVSDVDSKLYLFGTVHLGISGDNWGGPVARAALAEAEEVWTEVDIAGAQGATMQRLVQTYGAAQRPLSEIVGPQRWSQIEKKCVEIGAAPAAIDRLRPWVAALIFSTPELVRNPQAVQQSADIMIERRTDVSRQRRRTLETAEEQVTLFATMPEATQLALLYEALDGVDPTAAKQGDIVAAWAVGDDTTIARVFAQQVKARHPDIYEAIITRRNTAWTEVLARELADSGVDFVAVGAGHLAGPDSVQSMLAARGYQVTRLTPAP